MSQSNFSEHQSNICETCGFIYGDNHQNCVNCLSFLTGFETLPDTKPSNPVAVGGDKARDVKPLQGFLKENLCKDCKKPEGSNPACDLCSVFRRSKDQANPPFTKELVEQLHWNMKSGFIPPKTGRIFELVVPPHSLVIGSIDWTMGNCASSTFVLTLSSSNEGMNSINQQIFAGYILAVIIKTLQESGKCDPIILEVFRLELSILSGNSSWSNWSDLVEFQDLYKVCVKHQIIINDGEVKFVLPDDDGSYNVKQTLNGKKYGSTLVGAFGWSPPTNVFSNGILSLDCNSKFRISAGVLHYRDHFSIVVFSQGIWLIDGKGKRTGEFKAESSIRKLTIEQVQELFASHGVFYFLEKIPFVYKTLNLFGRQGFPPRKVSYGGKWYFLYDDGTMVCETTQTIVKLQRTVFMTDDSGNDIRVFPALPPQALCASDQWVPPPPPPPPCEQVAQPLPPPLPQASSASGHWFPPPPPPCAQSAQDIKSKNPHSVNIKMEDVKYCKDSDMMEKWWVSICHPTKGQITLSGGYSESMNQSNVTNYTFDSDNSEPKRFFKYEHFGKYNKFIEELNRQLNA